LADEIGQLYRSSDIRLTLFMQTMNGRLRFVVLSSVSPALTSPMTSPARHLHQQQQEMLKRSNNYANEEEESRSLSTPPLPMSTADQQTQQFIKAEPMSPSATAGRQRHVTSAGQGQTQGQGRTTAAAGLAIQGQFQRHTDCRHVNALRGRSN